MKLVFRPQALDELAEIQLWQARGLGQEFMRAVEATLGQIERFPQASTCVSDNVRRAVLRRFPYFLFYALEGGEVVILGCIHQQRSSIHWPINDH